MRGIRMITVLVALGLLSAFPALAQSGTIEGKVSRDGGKGLGGVTVVVSERGSVEITDSNGNFRFSGVPAGSYTLSFSLGDNSDSTTVEVASGAVATVDQEVDWDVTFAETITVFSASRRRERIVEAPAAVSVITEQQIERESTHGQLPKLLESTPGAEVTQSGVYDFNFNTRGFNSSLNRRILVLVDGRDPSVTFLGSQEWSSLTFGLDTLASVELVRGPGSALYGADAYNGVINMTTKAPRDSTGGRLKLTGGELSTIRGDVSISGALGGDTYARFIGGAFESDDFARSRNVSVEYPGLPLEAIPLPQTKNESLTGNLRLDKHWGGSTLSLETGYSEFEAGGNAVTGIGRTQITTSERFHFRANFNTLHWNFLAYHNDRESPVASLSSGLPLFLDSDKTHGEFQGNFGFSGGKGRFIGGASYQEENFDSTLPGVGIQTLVFQKVEAEYEGAFAQLEYDFSDKVRGVFSVRWDDSNLYDSQVSPRAALVFSPTPGHNFRIHYSEAFQSPNYSEQFLQVNVAAPTTALAGLEFLFCAPFGISCGLGAVPVLALGNPDIEVEEIASWEIGYNGVLGGKAFLTVDYYNNEMTNFITDLIPGFNSTLGLLNPAFGPYQAPSALPEPFRSMLEAFVLGAVPTMTNNPLTGAPVIKAVTYTNFGEVDTQGIELGLNVNLTDEWLLNFNYNWFDFDIQQEIAEDPLVANAPENQFGLGISYIADRWDFGAKFRHVESFDWAAGVFRGRVPSYDLVDLNATFRVSDRVELGVTVSNAFDEEHFQIFGGDLLERRALGHVQFSW